MRNIKKITVLLVAIFFLAGCNEEVDIEGEKVNYEELQAMVDEKEKDIKNKDKELQKVTDLLESNKKEYDELEELSQNKESLLDDIVEYEKEEIDLDETIKEKEEELDGINQEIVKTEGDPISVNPGTYYFGDDIEPGRYKLTYQDGYDGNVFFRGDNNFGETFGKGKYSIEEYTFYADEGDEIELTIPVLLHPTE